MVTGNPAVVSSMIQEHEKEVHDNLQRIDNLANRYNVGALWASTLLHF